MARTVRSYVFPGPPTNKVTQKMAADSLLRQPFMVEAAKNGEVDYDLQDVDGRWVASVSVLAEFPDDDQTAPSEPPKEEGPPSSNDSPSDDGGSEESEGGEEDKGGEDKNPFDKGGEEDKSGGGDKQIMHEMHQMFQALFLALGIPLPGGAADSPVPGAEDAPPPPGEEVPPEEGPPGDDKDHVVHERSLKPGETPPGGTPVGAPSFSSVRADNPFGHLMGEATSFRVNQALGATSVDDAQAELRSLAVEAGFKVKQAKAIRDPDTGENRLIASLSTY